MTLQLRHLKAANYDLQVSLQFAEQFQRLQQLFQIQCEF